MQQVQHLLQYMHTNPNAIIQFRASGMVLNIHSDASYLTAARGRSRAGGYFFLGSVPRNGENIKLNGNIAITCTILKLVATSAAEAELGALFIHTQETRIIRLMLHELDHPQPTTPIHIDNTTEVGIVNSTIKRQRSRSMEILAIGSTSTKILQFFISTRTGEHGRISNKTPHGCNTSKCKTIPSPLA